MLQAKAACCTQLTDKMLEDFYFAQQPFGVDHVLHSVLHLLPAVLQRATILQQNNATKCSAVLQLYVRGTACTLERVTRFTRSVHSLIRFGQWQCVWAKLQ